MIKTVRFMDGTKEVTLNVTSCQSYTLNAFKNVLRIEISEAAHSYEDVVQLKKVIGSIGYREDNVLKAEYEGYTLGSEGFNVNYANGTFTVELTQETSYEIRIGRLEETVEEIMGMLMEMN